MDDSSDLVVARRGEVLTKVARLLSVLGLVGFSIAFYVNQLRGRWVDKFIELNELDIESRNTLLISLLSGALLGALLPGAYLVWKRTQKAISEVDIVARISCPLVLLGATPAIFRWKPWVAEPIELACALALYGFILERTLRISLGAVPSRIWDWAHKWNERAKALRATKHIAWILVVVGALSYAIFMSYMAIRLHHRLTTRAFDLGGYESIFYNALSGRPFRCPANVMPTGDWSSLKNHADLTVYVLLPFYAISPRAETLLVIQSFLIGLGAIPLYLIAARHLSRFVALIVACSYLLFPSLHSANLFDFHMQPVSVFFVLWVAYFVESRRYFALAIALPLALGCREDISVGLTVGALFLVFTGYRPFLGTIVAAISAVYFTTIRFYIMPLAGEWWFHDIYADLFPKGEKSYTGVVKTLLTNPVYVFTTLLSEAKLFHVLRIFSPVAFLPLRRIYLWWLLIPGAFFTILTTGYPPTVSPSFQYVGHWIPYLFIATIVALAAIEKRGGKVRLAAAVVTLAVLTLAASYNWGAIFQRNNMISAWKKVNLKPLTNQEIEKLAQLREIIAEIPPEASVGASENELPHLSNRETSYNLRTGYDNPDYILYRKGTGRFGSQQASKELRAKRYVKVGSRGPFVLLKRKESP